MNANEITNKSFSKVRRGGLDENEVKSFLSSVAGSVAELSEENSALKAELESYRERENALAKALVTAEENAQDIVSKAEANAETIVSDAEKEAEEKIAQAEQDASERLSAANLEINRVMERLDKLREFEQDYRSRFINILEDEMMKLNSEFPTDELWNDTEEGHEVYQFGVDEDTEADDAAEETEDDVPETEGGKPKTYGIDLEDIYNDLPQTEDELRNLINNL